MGEELWLAFNPHFRCSTHRRIGAPVHGMASAKDKSNGHLRPRTHQQRSRDRERLDVSRTFFHRNSPAKPPPTLFFSLLRIAQSTTLSPPSPVLSFFRLTLPPRRRTLCSLLVAALMRGADPRIKQISSRFSPPVPLSDCPQSSVPYSQSLSKERSLLMY